VHFELTHDFDISLDALELAVISPELAGKLAAKLTATYESVVVKEHALSDGRLERVLFFQANLKLPPFARGVVTREMLAWDERTRYDLGDHRSKWSIEPRVKPEWRRYFHAEGSYALVPLGEGRTRRIVEGDIDLRVPVVVRQVAERMIVAEVKKTFEAEAATLKELATLS